MARMKAAENKMTAPTVTVASFSEVQGNMVSPYINVKLYLKSSQKVI